MDNVPTPDVLVAGTNQGRSMLVHWFPQWWGWYKTAPPSGDQSDGFQTPKSSSAPPSPMLMSPGSHGSGDQTPKDQNQLEDEILNALTGSVENNSLLKRDAVFGKFNFSLRKGTLDVCSGVLPATGHSKLMLQLQFENLLLSIESRPRSASHFVGLSLGTIFVKDFITNNAEFPDLIRPQVKEEIAHSRLQRASQRFVAAAVVAPIEPLFQMVYERKPLSYNTDYRLQIKSQSLDIVYNVEAIKWILDFVMKPHQVLSTRQKIEAMKNKTKMEFIKNWENILEGDLSERKSWALEIDIFAPQIIFAENFLAKNGSIVVCDFGRFQLTNSTPDDECGQQRQQPADPHSDLMMMHQKDSEEEEAFMTPCSTPPGSQASTTDSPTLCSALSEMPDMIVLNVGDNALNEKSLHHKLYDSYTMNLTDMQVLVCKSKERWSFASAKGSSPLHVLDRFCISLQMERRVVYTLDPQFPSLTMTGSLPKLVAHVNEHKIAAITQMLNTLSTSNIQSPHKVSSPTFTDDEHPTLIDDDTDKWNKNATAVNDDETEQREASKMVILQFVVDQMALEVQSRGRSIAELQVTGVKAGFSKRVEDTSLTLSVHGLLLVDAIQSFGPDFELLIASHRHVGLEKLFLFLFFLFNGFIFFYRMDSVSGSLKQSEPCSPNSPGSPDPMYDRRPTSPHTISKALSSLQRSE